jgi:hypothetical protein
MWGTLRMVGGIVLTELEVKKAQPHTPNILLYIQKIDNHILCDYNNKHGNQLRSCEKR